MVDHINQVSNSLHDIGFADVGIARIERSFDRPAGLPSQRDAQLTGQPINHKLDELFPQQRLEKAMRDFTGPFVADPSSLLPARFDNLVRQSASAIKAISEDHPNPSMKAAATILDEETKMRNLLHEYRMALMQA